MLYPRYTITNLREQIPNSSPTRKPAKGYSNVVDLGKVVKTLGEAVPAILRHALMCLCYLLSSGSGAPQFLWTLKFVEVNIGVLQRTW